MDTKITNLTDIPFCPYADPNEQLAFMISLKETMAELLIQGMDNELLLTDKAKWYLIFFYQEASNYASHLENQKMIA